jgi:hypothetical protein
MIPENFEYFVINRGSRSKNAYSGEVGHAFQSKPAGHSGGSRPPIPVIPATLVGA